MDAERVGGRRNKACAVSFFFLRVRGDPRWATPFHIFSRAMKGISVELPIEVGFGASGEREGCRILSRAGRPHAARRQPLFFFPLKKRTQPLSRQSPPAHNRDHATERGPERSQA